MYRIVLGYPAWMLAISLVVAFAYSWFLYRKKSKMELSKALFNLLFSLRFVSVFTISLLLLNVLIKWESVDVQKPIIVLAIDNSESMLQNKKEDITKSIEFLSKELASKYDLKKYLFGEKVTPSGNATFNEKETDISELVDEIQNNYTNRNLGSVVLCTDGIINRGENPNYNSLLSEIPFYSIAWGDTNQKIDLAISKVVSNKYAYLGNTFPIEVAIDANQLKGKTTKVEIKENGIKLQEKVISINTNSEIKTINFELQAKSGGLKAYSIDVIPISGEFTTANNHREVFIEIIENKEKILLLSATPHPDIAAIINTIQNNEAYSCDYFSAENFTGNLDKYNLVIFFQMPSISGIGSSLISDALTKKIPCLFTIGNQTNFSILNSLPLGFKLNSSGAKPNESFPIYNKSFSSFSIDEPTQKFLTQVPPLLSPFGTYSPSVNANVFLNQKIGMVNSSNPLMFFQEFNGLKLGFICGEGLWKWKLSDYSQNQTHENFQNFVGKIIQYLSSKQDKKPFRILSKNSYKENEDIEMDAELYNDINELVNQPDLVIDIINSEGKKFPFTFNKNLKNYHLNAGLLSPGTYSYKATISLGSKSYTESGKFRIEKLFSELVNSVANHNLLQTMAKKSGGAVFYPGNESKLIEELGKRQEIKPTSYTNKQFKDAINIKWIFFFILLLLSTEWFIRKRNGYY